MTDQMQDKLLLAALSIFFTFVALWFLRHDVAGDGAKWAMGIAGTVIGALLILINHNGPAKGAQG